MRQPDYYIEKVGQITVMKYNSLDKMLGNNKYSLMLEQIKKFSVDKPQKTCCYFGKTNKAINITFYYNCIKVNFNCLYSGDMDSVIMTNKLLGKNVRSDNFIRDPDIDSMDIIDIFVNDYQYIVR